MARFPIPSSAHPALWQDALRDYATVADITGSGAADPRQRNGKAVGHLVTSAPQGYDWNTGYSGLGFFTDKWGNQIWITEARGGRWAIMQKYKLWGRTTPIVLPLARFFGSSESGKNADLIQGIRDTLLADLREGWGLALQYSSNVQVTSRGAAEMKIDDFRWAYTNAIGALQGIDSYCQRRNARLDRPVVILLIGEPVTVGQILSNVAKFTSIIVNTVAPFAASLGVPELSQALSGGTLTTIQQISDIAQFFSDGGNVTIENFERKLLPIVRKILPDRYLPTVDTASDTYKAVIAGDYRAIAQTLGVSPELISSIGANDILSTAGRLGIVSDSVLSTANDILQNAGVMQMVDTVSSWAGNATALETALLQSGKKATAVPFLQNLWLNASGGAAFQIIPNVAEVISHTLSMGVDSAIGEGGAAQWGGMALSALGFPTDPAVYDELAYSALRSQVQQAKAEAARIGDTLTQFILPASVPPKKAGAMAQYLAIDEGINVLTTGANSEHAHYKEYY